MSKVHIVIPCYEHWNLTHELLWSLYRKERENITSVLVVDNGSTDKEVQDGLDWWKKVDMPNQFPIGVLRIEENSGFLLASNIGLKTVVGNPKVLPEDVIILLSNDVQIRGKFISQICDILANRMPRLVGGIILERDTGWNSVGGIIHPYLEGWLLATCAGGWKDLNYFDERFVPCDFEDVDISTTALVRGYELVPLNNVGLVHIGAATLGYNPEREANTIKNKEKFRQKWKN